MQLIDEILEYLQYHPMSSRQDVERHLSSKVSSATVKRQIARGIEDRTHRLARQQPSDRLCHNTEGPYPSDRQPRLLLCHRHRQKRCPDWLQLRFDSHGTAEDRHLLCRRKDAVGRVPETLHGAHEGNGAGISCVQPGTRGSHRR